MNRPLSFGVAMVAALAAAPAASEQTYCVLDLRLCQAGDLVRVNSDDDLVRYCDFDRQILRDARGRYVCFFLGEERRPRRPQGQR